ncbi:hypothetical protein [Pedobacter sp. SL55]|uniref:hypothetical protein n=1 Tax=Pedobacter sp. SL55 TaxID=2995161 RepID=UPI002270A9F3|nr:hypothetical protein [Pedobacter sp. SL55]WAC42336.1 hypothetical protein OVA16_08275 [Pedobacter sp. SL55]
MTNILIVCTNQRIAETIARLIDQREDWNAFIALSLQSALERCNAIKFDIALIGSGITATDEEEIKLHLKKLEMKTQVVKHYGGGSGLLYAEIYQALDKNNH